MSCEDCTATACSPMGCPNCTGLGITCIYAPGTSAWFHETCPICDGSGLNQRLIQINNTVKESAERAHRAVYGYTNPVE